MPEVRSSATAASTTATTTAPATATATATRGSTSATAATARGRAIGAAATGAEVGVLRHALPALRTTIAVGSRVAAVAYAVKASGVAPPPSGGTLRRELARTALLAELSRSARTLLAELLGQL